MKTPYIANQQALAASPAGILATTMTVGTKWLTPRGVVVVWKAWVPDLTGEAEKVARHYKWGMPGADHNTEIGVTGAGMNRVAVASVGDWSPAPST